MDTQRDYQRFSKLIARLCDTLGKPATDELTESWWKALRHVDYDAVASRVERFLARADESTKFPRPAMMRPKELTPPDPDQPTRDYVRDYWRSCVVNEACRAFGYTVDTLEPVIIEHAESLGRALREVIDELQAQEQRDGRTIGQHRYVQRRCEELAKAYPALRTGAAQELIGAA